MGWREHRRFKARARASSRPARCTFLHAEKSFAAGGAIGIRIGHAGDHESARPLRARSIRRCAYDARENRSSVSASSIGQVILGAWAVRLRNVPNMPFNSNPLPPSVLVQLRGEQHVLKHLLRRSCWAVWCWPPATCRHVGRRERIPSTRSGRGIHASSELSSVQSRRVASNVYRVFRRVRHVSRQRRAVSNSE